MNYPCDGRRKPATKRVKGKRRVVCGERALLACLYATAAAPRPRPLDRYFNVTWRTMKPLFSGSDHVTSDRYGSNNAPLLSLEPIPYP